MNVDTLRNDAEQYQEVYQRLDDNSNIVAAVSTLKVLAEKGRVLSANVPILIEKLNSFRKREQEACESAYKTGYDDGLSAGIEASNSVLKIYEVANDDWIATGSFIVTAFTSEGAVTSVREKLEKDDDIDTVYIAGLSARYLGVANEGTFAVIPSTQ